MQFKEDSIFFTDNQDPESYSLENQIAEHLEFRLAKDKITVTQRDTYTALALSVRDRMIRRWLRTQQAYIQQNVKKVYYLSLEYLMGRLLSNALINLNFYEKCQKIMKDIGYDLEDIIDVEHDMGLGNGGLGRLAACFLDSMASEELPAFGFLGAVRCLRSRAIVALSHSLPPLAPIKMKLILNYRDSYRNIKNEVAFWTAASEQSAMTCDRRCPKVANP